MSELELARDCLDQTGSLGRPDPVLSPKVPKAEPEPKPVRLAGPVKILPATLASYSTQEP